MVARLSAQRGQTTDERDAELRPVSVWGYLQRYIEARRALSPSERTTTMPKRSLQMKLVAFLGLFSWRISTQELSTRPYFFPLALNTRQRGTRLSASVLPKTQGEGNAR